VKLLISFCLITVLLGGCSYDPILYVSGSSETIGAEVYIDGQKVGVLEKQARPKPEEVFALAKIKVSRGKHKLTVVNNKGKKLTTEFEMSGSNYITVDFEDK